MLISRQIPWESDDSIAEMRLWDAEENHYGWPFSAQRTVLGVEWVVRFCLIAQCLSVFEIFASQIMGNQIDIGLGRRADGVRICRVAAAINPFANFHFARLYLARIYVLCLTVEPCAAAVAHICRNSKKVVNCYHDDNNNTFSTAGATSSQLKVKLLG